MNRFSAVADGTRSLHARAAWYALFLGTVLLAANPAAAQSDRMIVRFEEIEDVLTTAG